MPSIAVAAPPAVARPMPIRPASARWGSLDVLRGLALVAMIVHHFLEWTGGRARERLVGFDGFALTDLAAPVFALGAGAAAYLVGQRIRPSAATRRRIDPDDPPASTVDWRRGAQAAWRWSQVLLLGLAIDLAVGGGIDGGGVLPTLAVLGALVTAASALGVTPAAAWWGTAAACAALAVPAKGLLSGGDFWAELVGGSFSIVVYGTFAAAGAALAAGSGGAGEGSLPLWRSALAVVGAGAAATWLVPSLAREGLWPPSRHPGDLAFTLWGLAASLAVWAIVRAFVTTDRAVGRGLARAGQRTLLVFGAHYLLKLALQHSDLQGTLDTWRWGLVTWVGIGVAVALATIPARGAWRRAISSRDRTNRDPAVPVVRPTVRGGEGSGPSEALLQGRVPPG